MANKQRYSDELIEYIREIADGKKISNDEIIEKVKEKFNVELKRYNVSYIKSQYKIKKWYKKYTKEQLIYLKEISPGRHNSEITRMFNEKFNENRTEMAISTIRANYGFKNNIDCTFKKNIEPSNVLPTFSEVRKGDYIFIKLESGEWIQKNRYLYEKYNNTTLKDDEVVIFVDGNKNNFEKDNLVKVTRNELRIINQNDLNLNDYRLIEYSVNLARMMETAQKRERELK